jgi:hypothetical protein
MLPLWHKATHNILPTSESRRMTDGQNPPAILERIRAGISLGPGIRTEES